MMEGDMTFQSDAVYLLEMNLHNVRKELITMLEIYEQTECLECYQLKCKCTKEEIDIPDNGSVSSKHNPKKEDDKIEISIAPPAASLPRPDFNDSKDDSPGPSTPEREVQQDVEAWLDAAKTADDDDKTTISKETSILSLNDNLLLIDKQKKTPQVAISYVNNGNDIEAFFKYFKVPSNTAVTYVSAKLAAACKPKQNYSYF